MDSTTSHPQIDLRLIESALALGNKTMESMEEISYSSIRCEDVDYSYDFCYPKFYAYLLSPEFIEKFVFHTKLTTDDIGPEMFGKAIYLYQKGDSSALIYLLEKI